MRARKTSVKGRPCTNRMADTHKHGEGGAWKRRSFTEPVPSVWSRQLFDPAASEVTDCRSYAETLQTTNMHHQSTFQMEDIFFFLPFEQKVVVTCSWPAMRVKSSNWSSATSWQQNNPLIIIKRVRIRFIGPYRIFSKLLLNSKHQAAATKSSCVSFLRLEAKCFTV